MSVNSISELSRQQMLGILGYSSPTTQSSQTSNPNSLSMGSGSSANRVSPFAQMLTELQQLEQSNPSQYAKVSQQISTNLSAAAGNAQTQGNTSLASELTTLSKDFATASQTGQLPNVADLANAMHAGGSRHHHRAAATNDGAVDDTSAANAFSASTATAARGASNFIGQVLSLAGI